MTSERPRSRATIIAGGLTILAMAIIAAIFLLIASPWNDRHPNFHKVEQRRQTSSQHH